MPVEIVCHRGANALAPENTYAAAQLCLEWGVDYLEIDVRTSKDGELYLLHDATVDRTTNGFGAISELLAKEIDALDAGSWFQSEYCGQRVPRLEPFLRWIDGRIGIFFDVKDTDLNKLVPLVRLYGLADRCFFWFDNDFDALALRKLAPDFALKMNASSVVDVIRACEMFGATIIEVSWTDLSRSIIEVCQNRGLRLMIYEQSADPAILRQALSSGAVMLNTNYGDIALALREQMTAIDADHGAKPSQGQIR